MFANNIVKTRAYNLLKLVFEKHLFHLKFFLNQVFLEKLFFTLWIDSQIDSYALFLKHCLNQFINRFSLKIFYKNTLKSIYESIHVETF